MTAWTFDWAQPEELPLQLVSESFRDWFHRQPWSEVARCPQCSPEGDYGAAGRYSDFGNGLCPVCNSPLEEYWTDERVESYFLEAASRPRFRLYVMKEGGDIVAWTWIYSTETVPGLADLGPNGIYVDTFGFVVNGNAPALDLFDWGHKEEQKRGAEYFVFRTHVEAQYIRDITSAFGYRLLRPCADEPDREYHIYVPPALK